jgi:hypothetical protein
MATVDSNNVEVDTLGGGDVGDALDLPKWVMRAVGILYSVSLMYWKCNLAEDSIIMIV